MTSKRILFRSKDRAHDGVLSNERYSPRVTPRSQHHSSSDVKQKRPDSGQRDVHLKPSM